MSDSMAMSPTAVAGTPGQVITPYGGGLVLVILSAIFIPLVILAVGLRLYARRMSRRKLQANDYLAIVAAVLSCVYAMTTILAVLYSGVGHHLLDVLQYAGLLGQYTFALGIMWGFANTAVKLSILDLYVKIFSTSKALRITCYCVMGLSIAYCIMSFLQFIFLCQPIAFNWDPTIPGGHCADFKKIAQSAGIINLLIDVIIVSIPMPVLWGLQMRTSRKIYIGIIFGIGFLICIVSIVRIVVISNLDVMDLSYSVVLDAIFSLLEPCLGTINCCLPVLQPVVAQVANYSIMSRISASFSRTSTSKSKTADSSGHHQRHRGFALGNGDDTETMLTEIGTGKPKSQLTNSTDEIAKPNAIQVQQAWSVRSDH